MQRLGVFAPPQTAQALRPQLGAARLTRSWLALCGALRLVLDDRPPDHSRSLRRAWRAVKRCWVSAG